MDRNQVMEQLQPVMNTQVREVTHNPRTRVVVTPDMVTFRPGGGAHTLEMTQDGVQSLAGYVGLPWNVAAKLRPETFGAATTELLGRKGRYALVVKDGAVNAITRPGEFHNVNSERVLNTIDASIPAADYHRVLILQNLAVSIEVVGDRRQPVARGDMIQAGANIAFSPLGAVEPMVQSYVLRLACTNGQVMNTIVREFHFGGGGGGEGDNIWQWFRRSIRDAYGALDSITTRYQQMIEERIAPEDRAQVLTALLRHSRISGNDADAVRALALEHPPENSYDMLNLITYATSHVLEQPQRVRRAQLTAGNYASEESHQRLCPLCHRAS